jgi:hypothetical protein
MNDTQQKAHAAGFIHALRESADVRNHWYDFRKARDWDGLCAYIGSTLGLKDAPNRQDLDAMYQHAQDTLVQQMTEVQTLDARVDPRCLYNGGYCPPLTDEPGDSDS